MQPALVRALRAQRPRIRARWEDLLRAERSTSPLANPDTLVHLLDLTLDELLAAFGASDVRRRSARLPEAACPCGRNPLLVYFASGRQATREALVLAQAAMPALAPTERDSAFAELESIYSHIARREIESFCAVCQFRGASAAAPSLAVTE